MLAKHIGTPPHTGDLSTDREAVLLDKLDVSWQHLYSAETPAQIASAARAIKALQAIALDTDTSPTHQRQRQRQLAGLMEDEEESEEDEESDD